MLIRVSYGTLALLNNEFKINTQQKTAYLLQYSPNGCLGKCAFCPQSTYFNTNKNLLSRIVWPTHDLNEVVKKVSGNELIKRICLQTVLKNDFLKEIEIILNKLKSTMKPISLSITPIPEKYVRLFKKLGVDYVGVGLDTPDVNMFKKLGKPYPWETYINFIKTCSKVLGKDKVVTHLIIGLGEEIITSIKIMQYIRRLGSLISLFAFTPIKGTPMGRYPRPQIKYYRFMQIIAYLLNKEVNVLRYVVVKHDKFGFNRDILSVLKDCDLMNALVVNGCPFCDRPYYNESPKGPFYNYPSLNYVKDNLEKEWELIEGLIIE